ncbi:TPA: DUF1120 domain-containing protein [Klebsiella michiganensis]
MNWHLFCIYSLHVAMLRAAVSAVVRGAENFSINVTGKIMLATCDVSIQEGRNFDYGLINKKSLVGTTNKILPVKSGALTIACPAPRVVRIFGEGSR